jgi:hypothetical protein
LQSQKNRGYQLPYINNTWYKRRHYSIQTFPRSFKKIKVVLKWFPNKGNHINILTTLRTKFFLKVIFFLEQLKDFYSNRRDANWCTNKPTIVKTSRHSKLKINENYVDQMEENGKREAESKISNDMMIIRLSNVSNSLGRSRRELSPTTLKNLELCGANSEKFSIVNVQNTEDIEKQYNIFTNLNSKN